MPQTVLTAIILSLTGGLIYFCKSVPLTVIDKIRQRFIYKAYVYQYDELFMLIEKWLYKNYNSSYREVEAFVSEDEPYPQQHSEMPEEKTQHVCYKHETNFFIIKYEGKKIIISKDKEKIEKAQSIKDVYFRKYVISGLMAKKQINTMLDDIYQETLNSRKKDELKVFINNAYGDWRHHGVVGTKPVNKVILNEELKKAIIGDVDEFTADEKWYEDAHIPYKRNYLFYGPPGTGKTTLALSLSSYLKRNICCLTLNVFDSDNYLQLAISNIPKNAILLIEDIDKLFSGRENAGTNKVSFSAFINCLDGALFHRGIIIILTTNHIEKLDEALLRPGRIDFKAEVLPPSAKEISEYLSLFFGSEIKVQGRFNIPMSQIQEICIQHKRNKEAATGAIYELINL